MAARAFAAALQCPTGGCGDCLECRTALDGTHADVSLVSTSGLSIGVDLARELVQVGSLRPSVGRYRVIVVEDADRLTEQAANALLKMLEEPPADALILLVAHQPARLLPTIRSRCRTLRLSPLMPETMAQAMEPLEIEGDPVQLAALADGSVANKNLLKILYKLILL